VLEIRQGAGCWTKAVIVFTVQFEPVFREEQMFVWEQLQIKNIKTQKKLLKTDLADGCQNASDFKV
jgi:hypothetical protein